MGARKLTSEQVKSIEDQRIALVVGCDASDLEYVKEFGMSYGFAPEWMERDLRRKHGWDAEFCTVVTSGGGYQNVEPETRTDETGVLWTLVGSGTHGAERPCPVPENHPGRVTRADSVLVADPYRHSKGYGPRNESAVRAECPMCEERIGKEHGYVYIGEGAEYVYLKESAQDDQALGDP